jgi:hypothetical protein
VGSAFPGGEFVGVVAEFVFHGGVEAGDDGLGLGKEDLVAEVLATPSRLSLRLPELQTPMGEVLNRQTAEGRQGSSK